MIKYLKYELLSKYKVYLATFMLIEVAIIIMSIVQESQIWIGVGSAVWTTALFIIPIINIKSLESDICLDRKYLIFSVSKKSKHYLGAKIISTFIWIAVTGVLWYINVEIFLKYILSEAQENFGVTITGNLGEGSKAIVIISMTIFILTCLLNGYMAVIIGKMLNIGKKIRGIINLLVYFLLSFIEMFSLKFVIDMFKFRIEWEVAGNHLSNSDTIRILSINNSALGLVERGTMSISLSGAIFVIVLIVALFNGVAYMLDKKVDF